MRRVGADEGSESGSDREAMRSNERFDPQTGSFGAWNEVYFTGLDSVLRAYEPALRGAGRYNLELLGIMSRRAHAWLEIPARLGSCRTPQDLVKEQMRFWQTAMHDYAEGAQRLSTALGACGVPNFNGAWGGKTVAQPRDFISVEPKTPAAEPARRDRRAA
jgi:hypothetical protein